MRTFRVTIEGTRPMLMSNGRMADPLDPHTKRLKELTSSKKKSDTQHAEIGKAEFVGRLYYTDGIGPVVPGDNLFAVLRDGGRKSRVGKDVEAGVEVLEAEVPLEYDGPRDPQAMWDHTDAAGNFTFRDRRGVKQERKRVIRTRPKFPKWSATFTLGIVDGSGLNPSSVRKALEDGGSFCGLGDFKPRYGQFRVVGWEEI